MAIDGTEYQTYLWKTILSVLKGAAVRSLGEESDPNSFHAHLIGDQAMDKDRIHEWHIELWDAVSDQYRFDTGGDDDHNEAVSLAMQLVAMIKPSQSPKVSESEASLLIKKLEDLRKSKRKNSQAKYGFESRFKKSMADLFSELRYIKDAESLTAATGRARSATWLRRLAKIEELNRSVENIFSSQDLPTLAELMGLPLEELESNPGLVVRAYWNDRRPELILSVDRVFRAREQYKEDTHNSSGKLIHKKGEPKAPELPTNKYGNTVNPQIIAEFLDELGGVDIVVVDVSDLDWMGKLTDVVAEAVDDPTSNVFTFPVSGSPPTDSPDSDEKTKDAAYTCFHELESKWHQLGLIYQYPEVLKYIGADEYALLDGKITLNGLAKKAGLTKYKFEKSLVQAKQQYKDCVVRMVPELAPKSEPEDENETDK